MSGFEGEVIVIGVHMHGHPGRALKEAGSSHVVDMAMSEEEGHRRQIVIVQQPADSLMIGRGIDDHRGSAFPGPDDIRVGLRDPERLGKDQHLGPGLNIGLGNQAVRSKHPVDPFQVGQKPR